MSKLFISHSSQDDAFVRNLREVLSDHGQDAWIDSRQLRGGDPLWTEIQKAIEDASAYAVVISPNSLQSKWVGKELRHALAVRDQRGKDKFRVIPLSLNGTKLGMLEEFFGEEPTYISVSGEAGGVEAAIDPILVAMGKRLRADVPVAVQPKAEPLEELVLELTDLKFNEQGGASARARLVYEPATPGQPHVQSAQSWRFVAPIIEADELRWYLEKYAIWPSHYFRNRAQKVEENLVEWGKLLYQAAMPLAHTVNVMNAWAGIGDRANRRFSVYVDTALEAGAPEADVESAKEVATLLLALPWELLHDGEGFLFQGAKPLRVRRRLPNTKVLDVPVVATPIRILLVTARPEDDSCPYIDHRVSALPLVEAIEALPGLVKIHVLSPPTLPALREELYRSRNEPYHVVHFDGHGVYDSKGGLCFEKPQDVSKLEKRGHVTVFTNELGPLLRDYRIPLFFLEACRSAHAEKASESVASELLKVGVASVVAMSHSVLVETARRFVEAFYKALAQGKRVGDAMLEGQFHLKDNMFRGKIFGVDELRLEDWFVPVLYQEKDDPQLFKTTPEKQTQEDFTARLARRLGDLPPKPETGFVGRSRELLALQRLLREERYAVVRGQGGEGKTALAAEFARWMVRSQQTRRAAFVSVETHGNQRAVVDALGKQLINKDFSAAGDLDEAIQEVERRLRERSALLIIDNMESVLLPPFMEKETPEALSEDAREQLNAILALCERLVKVGDTRLIFTSREALPPPFDAERNRRELHQLDREDAVKLIGRVLNVATDDTGTFSDAAREEIEQLVDAVNCHARTLALLAPSLRARGVEATRESLEDLMEQMDRQFPGSREKSVFASVALSLQRMSQANQDRAHVLGVFHGGVQLAMLQAMTQWEDEAVASLAHELLETGLATPNPYNYLTLNPALCPYLRGRLNAEQREALTARWVQAMRAFSTFLLEQRSQNIERAVTLTVLELPNLFALLEIVQRSEDAEATIELATSLYELLKALGKPRLMQQVGQVRDAAAAELDETWTHAQFRVARTRIEQQLDAGQLREALAGAQQLLQRARDVGEQGDRVAEYDLAIACILLARVLRRIGGSEQALTLVDEAYQHFKRVGEEGMASACFSEKGASLTALGRLDEAVAFYEMAIRRYEKRGDAQGIAADKAAIGSIRIGQQRYSQALATLTEAREWFTKLGQPETVALIWHQIGEVYGGLKEPEAAEDAYRKSLTINVRLGDVAGQAKTLMYLGNLYHFTRPNDAATFYQQAIDKYVEIGSPGNEGRVRSNLAATLQKLRRFPEARDEIKRAITCLAPFGQAVEPWRLLKVLSQMEVDAGNPTGAADAKRKAIAAYLTYRRDGGENHSPEGRISFTVTKHLLAGDAATATTLLQALASKPDLPSPVSAYGRALQAIVDGSRDHTLADVPDLDFAMAAEILLVIETLDKSKPASTRPR